MGRKEQATIELSPIPQAGVADICLRTSRGSETSFTFVQNHDSDDVQGRDINSPSYWNLLRFNESYRMLLISYILTLTGEWYTYIATISFVEQFNKDTEPNIRTETGFLIMVWLVPNILVLPISGVLSDSYDRRKSMIIINLIGAVVTLGYLVACRYQSTTLMYLITFVRASLAALYEPCQIAILPMMVHNEQELKKATTLNGLLWSVMMSFGSALGGWTVSRFGVWACFFVDACVYLLSAFFLGFIPGTWNAAVTEHDPSMNTIQDESPGTMVKTGFMREFVQMFWSGVCYLHEHSSGPLVLLKFSAAAFLGPLTVLQAEFAESYSVMLESRKSSDELLGFLFLCTGIGSLLGVILVEYFADINNPRSLQTGSIWMFLPTSLAYFYMGFSSSYTSMCICSAVIYASVTVTWIQSDLIFQLFVASSFLGRVASVDFALATTSEGYSSFLCGLAQDAYDLTVQKMCSILGLSNFLILIGWCLFQWLGGGIDHPVDQSEDDESVSFNLEVDAIHRQDFGKNVDKIES